jgi:hypothetical protein
VSERVLSWDAVGVAHDRASGLGLQVERNGTDEAKPWTWFFTGWPVFPDGRENMQNEQPRGSAATEADAKRIAEGSLPTPVEIAAIRRGSEEAWAAYHKAQEDAAPPQELLFEGPQRGRAILTWRAVLGAQLLRSPFGLVFPLGPSSPLRPLDVAWAQSTYAFAASAAGASFRLISKPNSLARRHSCFSWRARTCSAYAASVSWT